MPTHDSSEPIINNPSMPTNDPCEPLVNGSSEPIVDSNDDSNEISFYPLVHGFVPAVNALGETQADLSAPSEAIVEVEESISSALDALACLAASSPGQHVAISLSFYEDFTTIRVAQDGLDEVSPAIAEFIRTVWDILGAMSRESKAPDFRRISAELESRLRDVVYQHTAHRTLHRITKRWDAFEGLKKAGLLAHYERYYDRVARGLENIRRELKSEAPNYASVFKSMEVINEMVVKASRLPVFGEFLERTDTKKRATLSHYLKKCTLAFPCICALKASILDQNVTFTEKFGVERVLTLGPPSLADEYPPNSAAWRAQFFDMLRKTRTVLRNPKRGDKLIKLAEELGTREGRIEKVHCECVLLAHCDRYLLEDGVPYHYFGTSTPPCYFCSAFFRAYTDVMPFQVTMRDSPTTRWKVPKSWVIVPYDDDERYERAAYFLMERILTRTAGELVRQNIGLEDLFWYRN
ncbi:hypothetical protein BOTBODRAFT_60568 [Botryobasidium botryosum FD-172 SS1]|uniref:Uncharacterized protein n=1 Tax=Botryobasidium botryosum (strain FD-172 SS1) TaxID=930990 RepID=A0A067M3P9_BOTB1|nr:hypothetical protein BOTBODRAFT_60568 [Botryobasidium botryosum FD-172 SS1]